MITLTEVLVFITITALLFRSIFFYTLQKIVLLLQASATTAKGNDNESVKIIKTTAANSTTVNKEVRWTQN